ncbi:transmembrane protease serine 4 [Hyperolius riggenbachi]|uniref:transmembrane protease serine 4 n=1 Tax=Hyperolius riggenbachi TaxID=752182 RepID=UPI0035A3207F
MDPEKAELANAVPLRKPGGGNVRKPVRASAPPANPKKTPDTQFPRPVSSPAVVTKPPVTRTAGPTRTPGPVRGTPRPNARPRPNAVVYKARRISTLRRYCVPVTTVFLVLASLVVIAILIKVVLDNYYFFCPKSFKFIPLEKWCDGQSDCSNNEDEQSCVQGIDFSNRTIIRFTDAQSILELWTSLGSWSYVCSDGFDASRAKAVCGQIGFSSNPTFSSVSAAGLNGVFSSMIVNSGQVQAIPLTGTCPSGSVVSLTCITCGTNHKKERIVGGHDSSIESTPWQVSLQYSGTHTCGGSVLTSRYIMTAAHCFQKGERQVDKWRVEAGHETLTYLFSAKVDKIYVHSKYVLDQKPYDIGIMRLKSDLGFSATVLPVCLPGFDNSLANNAPLVVTGWGHTVEGGANLAPTLQEVNINLISNDICNPEYFGQITDTMMCAGRLSGGADTCQGDSGGPMVSLGTNSHWQQVGIVSWGDGCGRAGKPGVYTKVSSYVSWIYGAMKADS